MTGEFILCCEPNIQSRMNFNKSSRDSAIGQVALPETFYFVPSDISAVWFLEYLILFISLFVKALVRILSAMKITLFNLLLG